MADILLEELLFSNATHGDLVLRRMKAPGGEYFSLESLEPCGIAAFPVSEGPDVSYRLDAACHDNEKAVHAGVRFDIVFLPEAAPGGCVRILCHDNGDSISMTAETANLIASHVGSQGQIDAGHKVMDEDVHTLSALAGASRNDMAFEPA